MYQWEIAHRSILATVSCDTHIHKQYQNCYIFAHHIFLGLPNVPFYFPLIPGRGGQQFQQWIHIILSLFPPGRHQGLAGPDWRCNPCSIWPINIVHPASVSPPGWTSPKHLIMKTSRRHLAHMSELTQQLCRKWKSSYPGCLLNLCPQERSQHPCEYFQSVPTAQNHWWELEHGFISSLSSSILNANLFQFSSCSETTLTLEAATITLINS